MISIMACSFRQHLQEMGQGVQVIDVIRRGIAREAQHEKTILANFAPLLHAARPPLQHRRLLQAEGFRFK